jgi:hypothetical protein
MKIDLNQEIKNPPRTPNGFKMEAETPLAILCEYVQRISTIL